MMHPSSFRGSKLALLAAVAFLAACTAAHPATPSLASQMTNDSLPLSTRIAAARQIAAKRDASASQALLQVISTADLQRYPRDLIIEARAAVDAIGEPVWQQARKNLQGQDMPTLELMYGFAVFREDRHLVRPLLPDIAHLTHSQDQMIRQTAAEVLIVMDADAKPYLDDLDSLVAHQSVIGNDLTQAAYTIVSNTDAADPRHVRSAQFLQTVRAQHEFIGQIQRGDIAAVRASLAAGMNPNAEDIAPDAPGGLLYTSTSFGRSGERTPAAVAAIRYNQAEILRALLAAGARVPTLDEAVRSSEEIRKILQDAGAKPGASDSTK